MKFFGPFRSRVLGTADTIRRGLVRPGRGVLLATALPMLALVFVGSPTFAPAQERPGDDRTVAEQPAASGRYVIHISVDGLRPDAVTGHSPDELPNFYRLRTEGAFTDHAHTDVDYSNTLPNHMAQLTGRPVLGDLGHHWTDNRDPEPGETVHSRRGAYVASAFDVAHDNGLRTGAYVSKSKFVLLDDSYDAVSGAPDSLGTDDGQDKIDTFVFEADTEQLVARFLQEMKSDPHHYTFLHLRDPDASGHAFGWRLWKWHPYMVSIRQVDGLLGEIFEVIETDSRLAGNTTIILTADHGGSGHSHGDDDASNYTIPFYVHGPGIEAGDLYAFNEGRLRMPEGRPDYDAAFQPVRNGSAANLALSLLGLDPVPGSSINGDASMVVGEGVRIGLKSEANSAIN